MRPVNSTCKEPVRNMNKINQIYLLLSFIFLICVFVASFSFYYSDGYLKLSNSPKNIEITNKINTQNDINKLREMTHFFHNSYIETLKNQSNSLSSTGKILTSIAVLCIILIIAIYKSKFLTSEYS